MPADAIRPNARPHLFAERALRNQKLIIAPPKNVARECQVQLGMSGVACKLWTGFSGGRARLIDKDDLFGFAKFFHTSTIAKCRSGLYTRSIMDSMDSPNTVIVGHVCVDHNTTRNASYTAWGSPTLYIAQYLQAQHFMVPLVITNYGPDLMPYLPAVDILPNKPNQEKTLLYENDTTVMPRRRRAFNTEFAWPPELTPAAVAAIKEADILIVATQLPNYTESYLRQLMSYVKPSCFKMLSMQGYMHRVQDDGVVVPRDTIPEGGDILSLFDVAVYSEEDHPKAFEFAREWAKAAPTTRIVVTQGPNGASIIDENGTEHVPTTPIPEDEIVDSVGCGDIFNAALAHAYFKHKDLTEAVRTAHKAAAKKLFTTPRSARD